MESWRQSGPAALQGWGRAGDEEQQVTFLLGNGRGWGSDKKLGTGNLQLWKLSVSEGSEAGGGGGGEEWLSYLWSCLKNDLAAFC